LIAKGDMNAKNHCAAGPCFALSLQPSVRRSTCPGSAWSPDVAPPQ
jgi:hypothetical protein